MDERSRHLPPPPPHEDYYDSRGPPPDDYVEYRQDEPREPEGPDSKFAGLDPKKRPPINKGTIIALIGFFILIIGILMPMYHLLFAADIQTSSPRVNQNGDVIGSEELMNFSTDGEKELLVIGGRSGIEVNIPTEDGGVEPAFKSPFPYGYIYVVLLLITIALGLLAKSPTKRGRRYIVSGVLALIPIFIILIIVSQLGTLIGEERLEPPLDSFVEMLSSGPMGGALPLEFDYEFENEVMPSDVVPGVSAEPVKVTSTAKFHTSIIWGLALGGYLIILGSIIVISGGILDIYISRINSMRLSAYREAMYRTYEDQHLSPDEANIILGLRKNLKISEKEHKQIKRDVLERLKI
jgi:hypothetical protein